MQESADLLQVLERIEHRGAHDIASRVKQHCKSVFDYAITKLLITSNPMAPLQDSLRAQAHQRKHNTVCALPHGLPQQDDEPRLPGHPSTELNEMCFKADWVERQLAHVEHNKVRVAYNHAQYLPERTAMGR